MRNSTFFERKHSTNSRESFVSGIPEGPLLNREKDLNSLFGGHREAIAKVSFVSFLETSEDSNYLLHTFYSMPGYCSFAA
jgi:hypothetical protein